MDYSSLINTASIVGIIVLPATGVAYGQKTIACAMAECVQQQPAAAKKLSNLYVIALAISETSAILCLLMSFIMIFSSPAPSLAQSLSHAALFLALGIPSFLVSIAARAPAQAALFAVARYPFAHIQLLNIMLLGLSMLQSPVILGFITALLIKTNSYPDMPLYQAFLFLAAGLCSALGSYGPTNGLSFFSERVCTLLGQEPHLYKSLVAFVFLSQALIETPLIFVFIVGLLHIYYVQPELALVWAAFAASSALGLSTIGAGISSGRVAARAAQTLAHDITLYPIISRMSLLAQTILDTAPIYGLITALLILFLH